jgi:hypothetical protein
MLHEHIKRKQMKMKKKYLKPITLFMEKNYAMLNAGD